MKSNPLVKPNRQSAQAMIEFALVFPLLVFLLYGILEFGRMLFIYTSVVNASREAARYGASVGNLGAYRFLDCNGILAAARRNAILNTIDAPDNLTISYDRGPGTSAYSNSCATVNESDVVLGDRINVTVTIPYAPLMPVNFASFNITSTASRTIIRSVEISGSVVGAAGTPTVTFSADSWPEPRDEGAGDVVFSVQLDFATDLTVVVPLNLSGTATNNLDYVINTVSVTLAPGETSKNVIISMIDDTLDEYNETVIVSMGTPVNAIKGVPNIFTLTIADNDNPPDIFFAAPTSIFDEEAGSVSVAVSLSEVSGKDITFNYNFVETGSTALLTTDFTLGPTAVTIPAGQPGGVLVVNLINDTLYENDELLNLLLASVNPGDDGQPTATITTPNTHALTIRNTDPPPVVNFELATSITAETVGLVRLKLRLNRLSGLDTTATLVVDGASTALLNTDYTIPTLTVTIPAGEIEAEFVVNITNDLEPPNEIDELLLLRIQPVVTNGTRGPLFNHTVTIKETLNQPSISFTTPGQSASEDADPVPVQIVLTNAWGVDVSVSITVAGTATSNVDYRPLTTTSVIIRAGAIASTLTIPIIDDPLDEDNETIILTLTGPVQATLTTPNPHVVTIVDNDDPPTVAFLQAASSYEEGSGAVNLQVLLSGPSARNIQVAFTVGGSAISGDDYTLSTASPLTFAPGATSALISLDIPDDDQYTGVRDVIFTLTAPVNATLGLLNPHILTIVENEICPTVSNLSWGTDSFSTIVALPTGATTVTLGTLNVVFEGGSQRLEQVYLGTGASSLLFSGSLKTPTTILESGSPSWSAGGIRTLIGGEGKVLLLNFKNNISTANRSVYRITITWSNGCTSTKP